MFHYGVSCLIVSLILPFSFNGNQRIVHSSENTVTYDLLQWLGLFGYAGLLYVNLWMRIKALTLVSPVIVAFVRSTEIVMSYIVQIFFFNTVPNVSAIIGSCNVILACVVVLIEDSIVQTLPNSLKFIF